MTLLIVRSRIVHLTPFLGSSYHLHSHFLSTWGVVTVVMLDTYKKYKCTILFNGRTARTIGKVCNRRLLWVLFGYTFGLWHWGHHTFIA